MTRYTRQRGFTLLELLIVIGLLGVVALLAWPDFGQASRSQQLKESAGRMRTLLTMCRAEAMNQGRCYRVEIRPDGTVRARRQLDPIIAPHVFNPVGESWANTDVLLENVWVEAVQVLPEGPPPILIVDQELTLPEMEIEPTPIDEFEMAIEIDFEPDGSCPSLRWVLRDVDGRAVLQTLDGRLGRVRSEDWDSLPADEVVRPEPLEKEAEEIFELEDFKE